MQISLRFHYIHHLFYPRKFKKELNRLYLVFLLRNLDVGMVGIFEPIYFFEYFGSLVKVSLYYASVFFVFAVANFWVTKFAGAKGIKKTIALSFSFSFIYYLLLWHIDSPFVIAPPFLF